MEKKKRIFHLDAIKAILICFVLYDHAPLLPIGSIPANLSILLVEMGIASFFMVSGATGLAKDLPPEKLFARVFYAYLGLLFWKTAYLFLSPWVFSFQLQSASKTEILVYLFFFGNIEGIETRHFWFTHAYISMLLATPFLRAFLRGISASGGTPGNSGKVCSIQPPLTLEKPGNSDKKTGKSCGDAFAPLPANTHGMAAVQGIRRWAFGNALSFLYRFLPLILTWLLGIFPFTLRYMTGKNGTLLTELNPFGPYSYMMFYYLLGGYLYQGFFRKTLEKPPARTVSYKTISMQNTMETEQNPQGRKIHGKMQAQWKTLGISLLLMASGLIVQLWLYRRAFHSFGWQGQQLPGHSYMTSAIPIAVGTFLFLRSFFLLFLPENKAGKGRLPRQILQSLGQHTLGIYYLHLLLIPPISRLLSPWSGIGINLLKCLLALLPCALLSLALEHVPLLRHFV